MTDIILSIGEDWRPEIKGWSVDILPFYHRMAEQLQDGAVIIEIGVYHGRSILYLAEHLWEMRKRNCKLYAVDSWKEWDEDKKENSESLFYENLASLTPLEGWLKLGFIVPVKANSMSASEELSNVKADLIFIDALHDYGSVKQDIEVWSKHLKPNGILSGHDYWHWGEHAGVGKAVDEVFPGVLSEGSVWYVPPKPFTDKTGFCNIQVRTELISIIVLCYNQSEYLFEALESINNQSYPIFEIIIVTGDEDSLNTANASMFHFNNIKIKVLTDHDKGRSKALNAGIVKAEGKYIIRLDADDTLEPTALEKLLYATPPNEDFTITTCNLKKFGLENTTLNTGPFFPRNQLHGNYILASSLFSTELFNHTIFNQTCFAYEDWEFWISNLTLCPVVTKVNEFLFNYRIHSTNASHSDDIFHREYAAIIHLLNPYLYPDTQLKDEETIRNASSIVKQKITKQLERFPQNKNCQHIFNISQTQSPSTVKPCLNMIVKNESKVIKRCLESIKEFISSWVIVDTGSTDGTQDLILETLKDIPGKLIERPWVNFGHNRSEAMDLAVEAIQVNPHFPQTKYLFIIDADDTITTDPNFSFPVLTAPAYQLKFLQQDVSYRKIHLVRTDTDFRFEGVTHEVLNSKSGLHTEMLNGIVYHCNNDGHDSHDEKAKFKRDVALLLQGLYEDPTNVRYMFYLAQSYFDLGDYGKALIAAKEHVFKAVIDEEIFWSLHRIAICYEVLGMGNQAVNAYLEAYSNRPTRAEPLYRLVRYYREKKQWELAYLFANQGCELTRPTNEILMVDETVYKWRMQDELAVACTWTNRVHKALELSKNLIHCGNLPPSEIPRVLENIEHCKRRLGQ